MLDTSVRLINNASNMTNGNACEMDVTQYPGFEDPDFPETSYMVMSSATKEKSVMTDNSSTTDEVYSPLSGQELSQDLFTLIDSFNLETPIENFDSGNSEAFQNVIDDVIDAAPSGDEFDFLDNICGFTASDIPVKNSSSVTGTAIGTACVYTCATEKDRCANQVMCARTASSTCISNTRDTWETLSQADQELLEKLPGFLENIDSVTTNSSNGRVRSKKRENESDQSEESPRKRSRSDGSLEVLDNMKDNVKTESNLSRDNICARGS